MALKQVGARTQGDVYQGLFFWRQAADLLRPGSMVERVALEHDEADGVDDVAVFYRKPGVNAGGRLVNADFYQLKYHVDNRDSYSSDALIDPTFINAKSSLLQRFHSAYNKLVSTHGEIRLHLASNWRWKEGDKLAQQLREFDGGLPQKFFDDGIRSDLGKVREKWRTHLELESDTFREFAKTLRFQLDHFGRRDFKAYVHATLEAAGLRTPSADRAACPYESLSQQFVMNGTNTFDNASFLAFCEREGLLVKGSTTTSDMSKSAASQTTRRLRIIDRKPIMVRLFAGASKLFRVNARRCSGRPRPLSIGVRSFVRFAERLESEVDEFVCTAENFEGRNLVPGGTWQTVTSQVLAYLGDLGLRERLRGVPSAIALECHGSLALLAGWELSRNSGVDLAPIQKPSLVTWRPSPDAECDASWIVEAVELAAESQEVAICLSVTHDVRGDVEAFLATEDAPQVGRLVLLSPTGGPSPNSVKGPDHANRLAAQLPGVLSKVRPSREGLVHVFFSCPNALMFFIGQQRDALGRVALYEFDFGMEGNGLYTHSLSLPVVSTSTFPTHEVSDESSL